MSTYLACFIVCDYQSLEPVKADQGFPLTVYAKRGQTENIKYAQQVGIKAINYYVNYFGIQYQLPKLGMYSNQIYHIMTTINVYESQGLALESFFGFRVLDKFGC